MTLLRTTSGLCSAGMDRARKEDGGWMTGIFEEDWMGFDLEGKGEHGHGWEW